MNSGFADRGLTTWLPRRILLQSRFAGFLLFLCCLSLPIVANFRELRKCQADNCASSRTTETGRTSTIWMASKSMTSESGSSLKRSRCRSETRRTCQAAKKRGARRSGYSSGSQSVIAKLETAFFKMVNEQGEVTGRKISFISLDDGYRPP